MEEEHISPQVRQEIRARFVQSFRNAVMAIVNEGMDSTGFCLAIQVCAEKVTCGEMTVGDITVDYLFPTG